MLFLTGFLYFCLYIGRGGFGRGRGGDRGRGRRDRKPRRGKDDEKEWCVYIYIYVKTEYIWISFLLFDKALIRSIKNLISANTRNGFITIFRVPVTKLGRLVKENKIKSIEQIYLFSLPIKEYQIVDFFLPKLKDEVMKIMPVQKQTRAGQRTRFKVSYSYSYLDLP